MNRPFVLLIRENGEWHGTYQDDQGGPWSVGGRAFTISLRELDRETNEEKLVMVTASAPIHGESHEDP